MANTIRHFCATVYKYNDSLTHLYLLTLTLKLDFVPVSQFCCSFGCFHLQVLIMLIGDPAYKFIHVEDFGYVVSYAPRTSFGDFQTMLSVSSLHPESTYLQ